MAGGGQPRRTDAARSTGAPEADRLVVLRQLPFAVVAAILLGSVLVTNPGLLADDRLVAAVLVTVAASTAAALVPWHRLHPAWPATVPVADMAAVALAYLAGLQVEAGLALPVLWLSRAHGAVGLVSSVVAAAAISWSPHLVGTPVDDRTLPRLLVEPAVFAAIGVYVYLAERRSRARQSLLEGQGGVLERTLAASRRQRRVLEGILNTIEVGLVTVDARGRLTGRNRAQGVLCPPTPQVGEPVDALPPLDVYAEDRHTPVRPEDAVLRRAARGERIDREVLWWRRPEGWRALGVSASPLFDERGRWDGAVVVYQDLTPELTAMAEQADFVASVSHELRTPLTSILGFAELLDDDPDLTERQRGHVRVIERNSQRLLRLIGDLLTARQLTRGGLSLSLADVDLCDVVAQAVEAHGPAAREKGVQVHDELTGPLHVRADRTRLGQVIDNVLSNAVKYSRPDGHVTLRAEHDEQAVTLRVRDDGVGIDPADHAKVFDRFYRAPAVRGGNVQGTGLGLFITREIVAAHGGSVRLDSEPGRGTEVSISLPAAAGGPAAEPLRPSTTAPATASSSSPSSSTSPRGAS